MQRSSDTWTEENDLRHHFSCRSSLSSPTLSNITRRRIYTRLDPTYSYWKSGSHMCASGAKLTALWVWQCYHPLFFNGFNSYTSSGRKTNTLLGEREFNINHRNWISLMWWLIINHISHPFLLLMSPEPHPRFGSSVVWLREQKHIAQAYVLIYTCAKR